MNKEEIFNIVANIIRENFDNEELQISMETCGKDIEGWDSLEHINIITLVENTFNIRLTMKEITSMVSVADIVNITMTKL